MPVDKSELISFYSHVFGAIVAMAGLFFLIKAADSFMMQLLSVIYGISVIALFCASTFYHGLKQQENEESLWRKFDHIAIFIMIAGTYTPVCYIYLDSTTALYIISAQWLLVGFGILFKIFYVNAPRILYTLIYVAMGWMAIVLIQDIISVMDSLSTWYLFLGGVSFTVGAVFYIVKWPKRIKGYFGFHEIFHIFILSGAFFHYLMVLRAIQYAQHI